MCCSRAYECDACPQPACRHAHDGAFITSGSSGQCNCVMKYSSFTIRLQPSTHHTSLHSLHMRSRCTNIFISSPHQAGRSSIVDFPCMRLLSTSSISVLYTHWLLTPGRPCNLAGVSAHQCQQHQAAALALADLALLLRPVPLLFPLLPVPLLLPLTTLTLLFALVPPLLPLLLLLVPLPLALTLTLLLPALLLPLAPFLVLTDLPLPLLVLALRLLLPLLVLLLAVPPLVLPVLPPVPAAVLEVVAAFCVVRGVRFCRAGAAAALHCLHSDARPVRLLAAPESEAGRTLPQPLHIWQCTLLAVRLVHVCGGFAGNLRALQLVIQQAMRNTVPTMGAASIQLICS